MTLSVILPNYNHAKYLPEALDAILAQSYAAREIIIVDDASTDASSQVILDYRSRYPQIWFYRNEQNLGPVATINRAVGYATGEYLAFCAADDRVLPGFFEECVSFLQQHTEAGLCTSNTRLFKDDGTYREVCCHELGNRARLMAPSELVEILRSTSFFIQTQAAIYRKKYFVQCGALKNNLKMVSDLYLNYCIGFYAAIGYIPKPLASFREGDSSYCAKISRNKVQREEVFHSLYEAIEKEQEPLPQYFQQSAVLSLLGLKMVLFLVKHPRYWQYLWPVLRHKFIGMVVNKLKQYVKKF